MGEDIIGLFTGKRNDCKGFANRLMGPQMQKLPYLGNLNGIPEEILNLD
jgi:hypothetical protein